MYTILLVVIVIIVLAHYLDPKRKEQDALYELFKTLGEGREEQKNKDKKEVNNK